MNPVQWWRLRQARERRVLLAGTVALLLMLAYLVLEPLHSEKQALAERIGGLQQDLDWMQRHAGQFRAAGVVNPGADSVLTVAALRALLDEADVPAAQLQVADEGAGTVTLVFTEADYSALVAALYELRNAGAGIGLAELQAANPELGLVSGRIRLSGTP